MAALWLQVPATVAFLLFLHSAQGQPTLASSTISTAGSGASDSTSSSSYDWGVVGRNDPLGFFSLLSRLDSEAQKRYLNMTGAQLQQQHNLDCNVFGGEASCMTLSRDSDFGRLCPNHDMKVDCAYYTDDTIEINEDPIAAIKKSMASAGLGNLEAACPTCFNNQRALWCAQTVPKCGSYAGIIEQMVLPVITKATRAQDMGDSVIEALSSAVPDLLAASSLTMPCREMCEAVVSSCSCDQEQSFGAMLEAFVASQASLGVSLPPGFTSQLFGHVYNYPLCSLYGNSSDARFKGTCTKPSSTTCEDRQAWCGSPGHDNSPARQVQELMAGQVANALFGWVDAPANDLFDDGRHIIDDADNKDEAELVNKWLRDGGSTGGATSHAGTIAHWIVLAVCVAVAAAGVTLSIRWRARQNQAADGYLAMTANVDDDADVGQPMVPQTRHQTVSV